MVKREIIEIDEEKCNGCGLCVPACHEQAIQIIDGKAQLIDDKFCDGLGDCLGECPQDAITITERETAAYDEEAVMQRISKNKNTDDNKKQNLDNGGSESNDKEEFVGCPGSRMIDMTAESGRADQREKRTSLSTEDVEIKIKSQLKQWPVQLKLVPEKAPYFDNADLLITADCVPFAYPDYHLDLLKNKSAVVGCPKLDNIDFYIDKLASIISNNDVNRITVAFMEVPCCSGMVFAAREAIKKAGKDIPLEEIKIGIEGERK